MLAFCGCIPFNHPIFNTKRVKKIENKIISMHFNSEKPVQEYIFEVMGS